MTLRHLKIFVTVCDTMNMTEAAEALFISQSAVSQAIGELEKHYELRLFERLSRKLYRTKAGERLLGYARHMIRMSGEMERDMKSLTETGLIRLGASVTIGAALLPELISAAGREWPALEIQVFEDNTREIQARLLEDKADLALVEGELTAPEIQSLPFLEDELLLICSPSHPFAALSTVPAKALGGERLIVREEGSGTRKTFEDGMGALGIPWEAAWTCNNADTIKAAVKANLGVSVISRRAVAREEGAGELVVKAVEGIRFTRTFKITYHRNKYLTPSMKGFMELCLAYGERL